MTVAAETSINTYTANGATTVFSYTFRVEAESELTVYVDDVEQTSGFTVSGVGDNGGGSVTFSAAPASAAVIVLLRDMPTTRTIDYQNAGDFRADTIDEDLDRVWLKLQQLERELDYRALQFPETTIRTPTLNALPSPQSGQSLQWQADGSLANYNPVGVVTAEGSLIYESFAAAMAGDNSAVNYVITTAFNPGWAGTTAGPKGSKTYHRDGTTGTASTAYSDNSGFYDPNGDGFRIAEGPISTAAFGAITDESTDNTTAVQNALNFANGRMVTNPDGAYFDLSSLTFPNNIGSAGYYNLNYRANDDTSSPTQPASNATNERINFLMNNNSAGYNNERQLCSGYSTGHVIDVRRDVDAPNIGAGQDVQFGRVSYVWAQDGLSRVQAKYTDSAGDDSAPGLDDGWSLTYIEPRVTLTGLDDTDFTSLSVGEMISGVTSGARGRVKSFGAGVIVVQLLSGVFVNERLLREPNIESTVGSLTGVSGVTNTTRSNKLGLSAKWSGNVFGNLQGHDAIYPISVGGVVGVQQSGQVNASYSHAEIILADDLSDLSADSLRWRLEQSTGEAVLLLADTEVFRVDLDGKVTATGGAEFSDGVSAAGAITPISRTSTQLNAIGNVINTSGKAAGAMVWNITAGRPVFAVGGLPGDVWKYADGTTANTPV